jgi:putative acetyltransferase
VQIRFETTDDRPAILAVVEAAFGRSLEARLVEAVWRSDRVGFGFVAEDDGRVVGHVLLSYVDVLPSQSRLLQVAPLAVAPERQRQGIGSTLIHAALEEADQRGERVVLIEGNPAYYERFGFASAAELGFVAPEGTPPQYFMARWLGIPQPDLQGTVVYPSAFRVT